ncbi:MAG TPA: phosphomethylpyrimidine synthase ThiC, partial [Dyadobacter sp.]|nr:phosphomethylpyrimidine synthase ThiC [Dyadobacter sp.]
MKIEKTPGDNVITRSPFPASTKIYVKGTLHPIEVAMREISLNNTKIYGRTGLTEANAPVTVYDTSGPYTDPNIEIDVRKGLEPLRKSWITGRADVEQLETISSEYGQQRQHDKSLDALRFACNHKPLRAKKGQN